MTENKLVELSIDFTIKIIRLCEMTPQTPARVFFALGDIASLKTALFCAIMKPRHN